MASVLEELRRVSKSDLLELVKMHLSFVIDVTAEEWDNITAYVKDIHGSDSDGDGVSRDKSKNNKSHTRYFTSAVAAGDPHSSNNNCKGPSKKKELASNIFGRPLTKESVEQAMSLVNFINKNENYNIEGIFRKSGQMSRQQELRNLLNCGVRVDLEANRFTPLDSACVLKEFLQKLREPLLTINHFELHYELSLTIRRDTMYTEREAKNAKRLKIVQLLLHLIPDLNRQLFMALMALLNRVANARDVTLMDERSLATILGQHILCPRSWTPKQVQEKIEIITDAMEFMLVNYDKLFNGPLELVMDARKRLKKLTDKQTPAKVKSTLLGERASYDNESDGNNDDDGENDTVVTFCKKSSETVTEKSVAELYAEVQSMPDTPHKRKLIRRFNKQNGFGTPMHVTGHREHGATGKWRSLLPWLSK